MTISEKYQNRNADVDGFLNKFGNTFDFDRRLFAAAVAVNIAYCDALFHAGVLTRLESERIKNGLQTILKRAAFYQDYFEEPAATDVHSFIEVRLVQLIGETGEKISIGRSREDQSNTAFRLWLRQEIEEISGGARALQTAVVGAGERQKEAVLPAYAHSRKAQPILWAHWCLAYYEMLVRDRERLDEVWRRVNVMPLGAADLTGTSFEIDREQIAAALGFEGITANSLDAAADADFAVETVGALALLMIHLSRLAEDLILYSAPEIGFVRLSGEFSQSIRHQEFLELVRGKTVEIFGHQTALCSLLKSLPLGVHKDLQAVKKTVFGAVDTVKSCLQIMIMVSENVRVDETVTLAAVTSDYLNAAELTDYLVQRNVSLKAARKSVGEIVAYAVSLNKKLDDLSLEEFQKFSGFISADIFRALSLEQSLASKNQFGGTAPERVFEALEMAKENLQREG
ncbi:MAG: argininosuccinate lyase [Pyrinomonadaceae bacterium]|nr:argininosuccinate lyase [Pyrinomonadaceae bacterium]